MEPYEGREPYIFISYARKDGERVTPYLEALTGAGWRVWWDRGIQAGEHWTETLVEKVEGCAVFCPLFSEAFKASRYCFEETDYAYRKDKTIVPLYLDALKPDSLRPLYRLLQARQDVRLYEYPDAAQFAERLGRESAFAPCRAPKPYTKQEPYIFISYARKDSDRVTPFLKALSGASYRFWYDANIQASEHWRETLFEKVEGCTVFCPLFSKEFNSSRYCFVETAWAYQHYKKIVPLYLEKLEKESLGQFYQLLQEVQGLPLYQYEDVARFAEQLGCEEAFALCKVPPEWNKVGLIQWRLDADGVLVITRNKDLPDWYKFGSIPPYQWEPFYGGSTAPWMTYRKQILSVEIADDIDAIGDHAFEACANLTTVRIGDSVTEIGDNAFAYCKSLTDIRIPDSVTQIGEGAFAACASLTTVRIPDSVTEIGDFTFSHCKSLTTVRIPDGVTQIGDGAFRRCLELKCVEIPAGAKVGKDAFDAHTRVIRRAAKGQ